MYAGYAHVLQSYDLDGVASGLLVVPDAAVDFAAETASNEVLQVKAVPTDPFLALQRWGGLWVVQDGLFGIAGFHVEGAVRAAQLVALGGCRDRY